MDQQKIGLFISKCRKDKKLTQVEFAEKIGVSNRAVSKWETGRCMPDISLFKMICKELDITINEFLSGERLEDTLPKEVVEKNIESTIEYSNNKINKNSKKTASFIFLLGILITFSSMIVLSPDSSLSALYLIFGVVISLIGFSLFTKKHGTLSFKKILLNFLFFLVSIAILYTLDYVNVITNKVAPRFSTKIETEDGLVIYHTPMYNVYRVNKNTVNEYYIVDKNKIYTKDTVPVTPFDRDKSGISNLLKYKNKYLGNNSNLSNLIYNLPLSEYGNVLKINSKDMGITINYHITDWYIKDNMYLQKSIIYNSVTMFSLIQNLEYIKFSFSGGDYVIKKEKLVNSYPNYSKILENDVINTENFNKYVESMMNDTFFIQEVFQNIFK